MNVDIRFFATTIIFIASLSITTAQANKYKSSDNTIEIWDQYGLTGFVSFSEECKSFGTQEINSFISPECHITFHNNKEGETVKNRSKSKLFNFFNSIKDNDKIDIYYSYVNKYKSTVHIKTLENEKKYQTELSSLLMPDNKFVNPLITAISLALKIGIDSYSLKFMGLDFLDITRYKKHRQHSIEKFSDEDFDDVFIVEIEQAYTAGFMFNSDTESDIASLKKISVHDHIGEDIRYHDNALISGLWLSIPTVLIAIIANLSFDKIYTLMNFFSVLILCQSTYHALWAETDDISYNKALYILQEK